MKIDKAECICGFCEHCAPMFDEDMVLCEKHGIVPKGYSCRRFSYDPLKRIPPKTQAAPTLEYVDIDE